MSRFIDDFGKEEIIVGTIDNALNCLSELYSVCIILKENPNYNFNITALHRELDNIIELIEPYIKVNNGKVDYEELHKKIALKKIQNMVTKEIAKCDNPKKLSEIHSIVSIF